MNVVIFWPLDAENVFKLHDKDVYTLFFLRTPSFLVEAESGLIVLIWGGTRA